MITSKNKKTRMYKGIEKGNGTMASGFIGMYFEKNKDIPVCLRMIMNEFIKDEMLKNYDYKIIGIYIDYNLKMVDVKYIW